MKNLELALRYMEIFFPGGDPDAMADIFAENLVFEGPFKKFDNSADYIASLKADPPIGCEYKLIRAFEAGDSVNLVYDFIRGEIRTPMLQLFELKGGKIVRILLVFDTSGFVLAGGEGEADNGLYLKA